MLYTKNQLDWIINPQNLSFQRIKNDLTTFVQARPDYERWKDFLESSTGTIIIELIASLGTYNSFHALNIRREAYIYTAWLYTSALNIASMLGYPVNRVISPRLTLIVEAESYALLDRNYPIAYYGDIPISLYASQSINVGTNTLDCFMGEWKTFSKTITETRDFHRILLIAPNIDNNSENLIYPTMEVILNSDTSNPLSIYKNAEDLDENSVLEITHQDGVILAFGDDFFGKKLKKNDTLDVNYIIASDPLDKYVLTPSELVSNIIELSITGVSLIHPGYHRDELQKIAHVAPGYFASKKRMVTGDDHVYIFLSYAGSMISASYSKVDGACCTIQLCYLFDDEHIITDAEETNMLTFLDNYKMVGEKIEIVDPDAVGLDLKMTVIVEEGTSNTELRDWVISSVNAVTMSLGGTFHIGEITRLVSEFPGVIRVYLSRPVSDKELFFNQYIVLRNLDLTITSKKNTTVTIDPSDNGYL